MSLGDLGNMILDDVSKHPSLTLLCGETQLSATVAEYGGMMCDLNLVHCGDFVKYSDSHLTAAVSRVTTNYYYCHVAILGCSFIGH